MASLKEYKPEDFRIIPAVCECQGCIFLQASPDRICKITRDLDLLDLAFELDRHFGQTCHNSPIIYKLKIK